MSGSAAGRRRSRLLVVVACVAVLATASLVVLAVRSLPPDELDRADVERDIASEFEERRGVAVALDCPDMPVASGEVYHCDGTTSAGVRLTVEIQIGDRLDGSYRWADFPGPVTTATPASSPGG